MTASARRLPWYRRLAFRLAVLVTLLLLGFDFVVPRVFTALHGWLVESEGHVVYSFTIEPDSKEIALRSAVDGEALALLDAGTGASVSLAAIQSALVAWRGEFPTVFLVCDAELRVRAASPCLRLAIGEPAPSTRPGWEFLHWFPLRRADVLRGWLALLPPPPDAMANGFAAEWAGKSAVVSQSEMDARYERMQFASEVSIWVLRLALVAIVALSFSWLVTRRLARLAAVARADLGITTSASESARGSDEIAALAQALGDSRQRVQSLLDELGARDRARREWIAQVSHDLRTPLTALVARLERALPVVDRLLAQCAAGSTLGDANELRTAIDVALADADRVAQLARDLLEAARLDLPDQLETEPLLVGELVLRVGQELAPLAAKSAIALSAMPSAGMPMVPGDGRRLLRVLENLVRNAIEHAHGRVEVRATAAPNGVLVEVLDDGPGLLTDPAVSDARRADAAGLGLQIARRILAAHGSELVLADRQEGGCCSRFVLAAHS
ncbi:MAG: HAMP domain-containing sensor histidine kinase [Planctomycetota bacterium]